MGLLQIQGPGAGPTGSPIRRRHRRDQNGDELYDFPDISSTAISGGTPHRKGTTLVPMPLVT
jgi:hypothetical protein